MIKTLSKNSDYEFEARLCSKNFIENAKMDYYKFENILNNLIFSKEFGGYNFNYSVNTSLDVKVKDYRLSIDDKDSVKLYWLKDELSDDIKYKFIQKNNIEKIDLHEYNIRLSLSKEVELDNKKKSEMINLLKNSKVNKTYRLKNRYFIETPDKLFRFDLTSIKMANGISFKKSNVFKNNVEYEVELEYTGSDKNGEEIFQQLFKNINILLTLYYDNLLLLKNSDCQNILESYKKLATYSNHNNDINPLFIVANPITLHKINLVEGHDPNIINDYAVTLKADGIRNLLYILDSKDKETNGNIYLIDNSMNIRDTGIKNENWAGTIIEGEFIKTDNLFLAFDILYEKGNNIRNLPLVDVKNSRLGYLNLCLKSIKSDGITIKVKEYRYGGNIFEKISELWSNKDNYEYNVDGLIFTPVKDRYPMKIGTWDRLFKWKPPKYNSFDFLIQIEKSDKGMDVKSPFIMYKDNGETVVHQYKTLILYVGKLEYEGGKRIYKPVEFNPLNEDEAKEINRAKILLDRNERMLALDPITGQYSEILEDTIVEFVYDKSKSDFKWIPIRVRHDKTERYKAGESIYGNNEKTANDIWKSVINPLTFEELSLGSISKEDKIDEEPYYACQEYEPEKRLPFQNFHNLVVKMGLIKETAPKPGGKLLDLACGKAGDLSKWSNAKYGSVVSIDIDKKCLEYAVNYYDNYKNNKPEVIFIWGDTSRLIFPNYVAAMNNEAKIKMKDSLPSKYIFDVVSIQFCLHYYLENEIKLRTLLQNINDNLKIGGYLIGTSFDGERVVEALKNKKLLEGKMNDKLIWKITKLYKGGIFNSPRSQYGKEVDVYVSSINMTHKESLINFEFLNKMMEEYGLTKVKITEFAEIYEKMNKSNNSGKVSQMSDTEKDFSFLNSTFIFKKVSNTSDMVYKKLQMLIDKEGIKNSGIKTIKVKKI